MPLRKGTGRSAIGQNISEMETFGHPKSQAIAAALNAARRSGAKIRKPAQSGRALPLTGAPGAGAADHVYAGPLHSHVPGRTDKINLNVKPGSNVIPADVVSMIGEGNTLAGSAVLKVMFGQKALTGSVPAPHARPGIVERRMEHHAMLPGAGQVRGYEDGGEAPDPRTEGAAPVVVAGGEHIIAPEEIKAKFGDLAHGHKSLAEFVGEMRRREIKRLRTAPPPKRADGGRIL
jgi:hypothetical protein